jgi:nitrite reductase/ring-hydroxylating ferredoxin subunit
MFSEKLEFPEQERNGTTFLNIGKKSDLPRKRGKNFYFDEELQVAVFVIEDTLYAVSNICPHQHLPGIADGCIDDATITCPIHGWIFSLETGRALGGNSKLKRYEIFEEDDTVWLEKPVHEEPAWMKNW